MAEVRGDKVYSLLWKTYDLRNKTVQEFIREHPYAVKPASALSKMLCGK
jgi:hypothetical protein